MADAPVRHQAFFEEEDLPAIFRTKSHSLVLPAKDFDGFDFDTFVDSDLSVKRIDNILPHLWIVGRPYLPRPLNIQAVLNRTIVATTDASLHLVWTSGKIFVKPLPAYILSDWFYNQCLQGDNFKSAALGLLYSYLALVPTELDFELAKKTHLFPDEYTWAKWKSFARDLLTNNSDIAIYDRIPKRYLYGELRLSRLDKLYRYFYGDWLHGYSRLTGPTTYADYFTENLGALAALTAYIAIVLTAMSVGLVTDGLKDNTAFNRACYGFTVFAIVAPMVIVVFIFGVFVAMFFTNWSRTLSAESQRFKELGVELSHRHRLKAIDGGPVP